MAEPRLDPALLAAIRAGGEALDRGLRGPAPELDLLRAAGLLVAPLPVACGGSGWDGAEAATVLCDALVALGGASLPIARIFEGHVNAVKLVMRHGSAVQRTAVAERVLGGALLGVWGADGATPVVIEGAGDAAVLVGSKLFSSGLGDVALGIVLARSEAGLQMVLVAADDPARADHDAWDVAAMVGSRSGRFDCTGLPAGPAQCVGGPDAVLAEPEFHGGLWRLAACYAGAMEQLARATAALIDRRGQRESAVMQLRLGNIALEAHGALLWTRAAAAAVEGGGAAAVQTALFAREAVEQGALRLLAVVERIAGSTLHRRDSELGRSDRDLRFYLRQADLDGKLALATSLWSARI